MLSYLKSQIYWWPRLYKSMDKTYGSLSDEFKAIENQKASKAYYLAKLANKYLGPSAGSFVGTHIASRFAYREDWEAILIRSRYGRK